LAVHEPLRDLDRVPRPLGGQPAPDLPAAGAAEQPQLALGDPPPQPRPAPAQEGQQHRLRVIARQPLRLGHGRPPPGPATTPLAKSASSLPHQRQEWKPRRLSSPRGGAVAWLPLLERPRKAPDGAVEDVGVGDLPRGGDGGDVVPFLEEGGPPQPTTTIPPLT